MATRLIRMIHCDGSVHVFSAEESVADQLRIDFKAKASIQTYDIVRSNREGKLTVNWSGTEPAALVVEDTATSAGAKAYKLTLLLPSGEWTGAVGIAAGQIVQMTSDQENEVALPQEYQVAASCNPLGESGNAAKLVIDWNCLLGAKYISVEELPPPE